MFSASPLKKAAFFAVVICAAIYLLYLEDDGLGLGWQTNVIHNWQQFGLVNLHGKLVANPGGFEVAQNPEVYKGMSPVSLYPVYLAVEILGWTGLGTLSFHVFLLPIILWASWSLLGRDLFAVTVAAVAVLCPGYMRLIEILDPNGIAVLPALPYAAIALTLLRKPQLTPGLAVAFIVLTLAFMSLNWATAWICGPCVFFLWGMPGVNRRRLIFLVGVMAIGVLLVVAASFAAKANGDAIGAGSVKPLRIVGGYLWGNYGYGEGLTTGRAFLRLAFVNVVGLFPLCLVLVYVAAHRIRNGAGLPWFAFTPLALAIADMVIMRNYFGHHPPLGGPLLLVGLLFSIVLLRVPSAAGNQEAPQKTPFLVAPATALLCFVYGLAVLTFFRANEANRLDLAQLVRDHTARSDTIVILKDSDPNTASMADRLDEVLDRHVVMVDDARELAGEKGNPIVLSSVKLPFVLIAQSAVSAESWINKPGEWFSRTISRRSSDDRLQLSDTFFLYSPGPGHALN